MRAKTTYSVMVSSTYIELVEHRRAIVEAMLGQRLLPIAMEYDAALPDQDLTDASLAKVDEADAYVGLISYRYGQMPECPERNPDRLSLTELEFRRAIARGIPICMFIMRRDHLVPSGEVGKERGAKQKLRSFLNLAKNDRIYAEFKSVDDLKTKAVQSLVALREALDRRAATSSSTSRDAEHKAGESKRFAISNILISVPLHFLGRDDELEAVDAALKGEKGRIAALHGLRGVGKSTLAVAYAERHRSDYRTTWWIRAQTPDTMRANLVALGVRLGWVAPDEKEEPALATVRGRLRDEGEGLLLIYDNAIDAASLRPYLPPNGAARVLVTSNSPAWRGVATPVEIRVWPKEVGADYLIARTGHEKERAEAEALSQALGGLTLAHEQAAAYCERVGVSFAEYRKRFTDAPARLLDAAKDVPPEYGLTVAKAFSLAIDEAAKLHPAAEPVITYAALLAPEPIPLFLFSEARETFGEPLASQLADDGLDEAVAALRAFALVDRETIPDERDWSIPTETIRLHRLVRAVAAGRCVGDAREEVRRFWIEVVAKVYPRMVFDDPSAWPRARRLDALALDLVGGDAPLTGEAELWAIYLLDRLGTYRHAVLAAYSEARQLFQRALAISDKRLGPEHPGIGLRLNNLALLLKDQGDFAGARPLFERALAICERTYGPEHPHTATNINNLALLLQAQGDLAGARPLFERALAINEKALGPEHPQTALSLENLGLLLRAQGDPTGARLLAKRALTIREKELGPEHPHTAMSLENLASSLQDEGDLAGARPLFERALAIKEKALGPEHPDTATGLSNLAGLLKAQGDLTGARPLFERALAIKEKALGPEHPDTATGLSNLASLFKAQGDQAGARPLFEQALAVREKALGPDHPETATSLGSLGRLLKDQGDFARARPLLERALAIREKALGPDHPETATSLGSLARLLKDQGDFARARPLYERAMAIDEKVYGREHPEVATDLNNLAVLLRTQGDLAGARQLYERALAIGEKALGPEHPEVATNLNNLADLLLAQGDLEGARLLCERALAIRDVALGPEHPDRAESLNTLASTLEAQGDLAGARQLYERALAIWEKALGPEHPKTATCLSNLASLFEAQGDLPGARTLFERALAVREKALGPEHPDTNASRGWLAGLLLAEGAPSEALPLAEAALASHAIALGPDHSWTRQSARITAYALDALGRPDEAATLRAQYGL